MRSVNELVQEYTEVTAKISELINRRDELVSQIQKGMGTDKMSPDEIVMTFLDAMAMNSLHLEATEKPAEDVRSEGSREDVNEASEDAPEQTNEEDAENQEYSESESEEYSEEENTEDLSEEPLDDAEDNPAEYDEPETDPEDNEYAGADEKSEYEAEVEVDEIYLSGEETDEEEPARFNKFKDASLF